MVTLDTLLIVSSICFGGGVLTTLFFGLLVAILRNTKKDEDETEQYAIPLSTLMSPGGGNQQLMEMYRAAQVANANQAAHAAEGGKKEETKQGQYL